MDISSAIIYADPRRVDAVRTQLESMAGVEIHSEIEGARFIITVEDMPGAPAAETVVRLHQIEGVAFAAMVYQYSDDEPGVRRTS